MWKQKKIIEKVKIRYQIFIVCLLTIGISSLLTYLTMYTQQKQMLKVYYEDSMKLLESQEQNISVQLDEIEDTVFSMCLNNEFTDALQSYLNSNREEPNTYDRSHIENVMRSLLVNGSNIKNVWIHTTKGDFYSFLYAVRDDFDFNETQIAQLIQGHSRSSVIWGIGQKNELYEKQVGNVIPMVFRYKLGSSSASGYESGKTRLVEVITLIDENAIYRMLNGSGDKDEQFLLMNDEGQLVFGGDEKLQQLLVSNLESSGDSKEIKKITYQGTQYLVTKVDVEAAPWTLIRLSTEEAVYGNLQELFAVFRILVCAIAVVAIFMGWTLSRRITTPLEELAVTCEKVGMGEMSVRFENCGQPEIQSLGKNFNGMLDKIDHLIRELEEQKEWARIEQLLKRRAELKALQSQINPHFLYNTLESISWKAVDAGCDEISDMSQSLATMFRTGLSQGKEVVPLHVELKNVVSYLEIQKIRYEDLFEYEICVEPEVEDLFVVKLILQPLVENSIYHGLKEKMVNQGKLQVMVCDKGEYLEVDVRDNGRGFINENMERINQQLKDRILMENGSYGIYNVNERLKLYFGEEYGLHYEMDEEYTHAIVRFPKVPRDKLDQFVWYYGN